MGRVYFLPSDPVVSAIGFGIMTGTLLFMPLIHNRVFLEGRNGARDGVQPGVEPAPGSRHPNTGPTYQLPASKQNVEG